MIQRACICFLSWNRFLYTKQSLLSIIENTNRSDYDLFVWDNGSTEEGMIEWLKDICVKNKFYYVFHGENVGLTTAMNWQMKIMNSLNKYDVFCHIANDVIVPKNWLAGVFKAISHEEVGVVGLNLEEASFPIQDLGDIKLEKLRKQCNVGGMHFCIPKRVYDLIGGFKQVDYGYGQQDANYSLIIKLLPNNWWIYYLLKEEYKGEHLGLLNYIPLTEENKAKILYKDYHQMMVQRLKNSANDKNGGRNYRNYLHLVKKEYDEKKITYEQLIRKFQFHEFSYRKVFYYKLRETNLSKDSFF